MDWSKAKTILIISFLLINLFLFLTIMLSDSGGILQGKYIEYAEEYLGSKGITIHAKIPKHSSDVGKIVYTPREYDTSNIAKIVFGKEVSIPDKENLFIIEIGTKSMELSDKELYIVDELPDAKKLFGNDKRLEGVLYSYLKKLGYKKANINGGMIEESSSSKEYKYTVKYKKALVFDLSIRAQVDNEGMLTLSVPTWDVKKENEKKELLSPYQVLVMANIPNESTIENLVFGYKQFSEGDLYGNPIWQVTLSDGKSMYYNAYTGEEL